MEKTCFVIMPFGEKKDIDGNPIDFDKIYKYLIKSAVTGLGINCIRCDEISEAGSIHIDMFRHIGEDDIAVVDISTLNSNVFYELGIRHALKKSVTVILRRVNTTIPFNLNGIRVIEYNDTDLASVENTKAEIKKYIENGLQKRESDSPVYDALPNLKVDRGIEIIAEQKTFPYDALNGKKSIALITGDIKRIKNIDIWVSSENTNMQMARYYDKSISGIVRYMGAKKDVTQNVVDDTIAKELSSLMTGHTSVNPGTVIPTGSGELLKTNNVKMIFHAAAVIGSIGQGYTPIGNIESCVTEALRVSESYPELKTILFPLLGTGTANGNKEDFSKKLIEAAINYLKENPACSIEQVYFSVFTKEELEICKYVVESLLA